MNPTRRLIKGVAILQVQKSIALNGGLPCSYGSERQDG